MSSYKSPSITVDAIIEKENRILMIRRKSDTFDGYLAFPGGFVDYGEPVEDSIKREVKEELGLTITINNILGVYSAKNRDPRGHVVSIVFICESTGTPIAGSDAQNFEWVDLEVIESTTFAFDHAKIINDYIKWKSYRETYWSTKT